MHYQVISDEISNSLGEIWTGAEHPSRSVTITDLVPDGRVSEAEVNYPIKIRTATCDQF